MSNHKLLWAFSGILLALGPAIAASQALSASTAANEAQRQVTAYLAKLADLHCTELVTQEKLTGNGHIQDAERAKYDYLIMIDGNGDQFQLNESRIESSATHHKSLPMMVTNGFSTLLLVFHPYYRDSFTFSTGSDEEINGKTAVPIHFSHIPGRRTPAALALRGREYPLDLKGTAWLDKQSGEVLKIDAGLLHSMEDIGLRSLSIHVEYKPEEIGKKESAIALPTLAVVDVTTPRQHWRNTHIFDNYKSFSTDAEQNPDVKIHADNATPDNNNTATVIVQNPKEKP